MFKKKQAETGTGQILQRQTSLPSIAGKAILAGVAVLFLLALVGYLLLTSLQQEKISQHAEAEKIRLNFEVDALLKRYVERVNLLAADPNLLELVNYPDSRKVRENDLAAMIDASQVMMFAKGEEKQLAGHYPLLSFSELDLIYEAEKGQQARLEYHKLQDGSRHLDIVRPFKEGQNLIGYVLVRFDSAILDAAIKQLVINDARLELSQVLSNGSIEPFVGRGDEAIKATAQEFNSDFSDAQWRLSYWEKPKTWLVMGQDWRVIFWLGYVLVAIVLTLMMRVFSRVMDKAVVASANVLYGYVRDRLAGQWMGKDYKAGLDELQPTLNNLQTLNWSALPSTEKVAVSEAEVKRSAAEESEAGRKEFESSYVNILYQNEAAIEIEENNQADAGQVENKVAKVLEPVVVEEELEAGVVPESIFRAYDIRGVVGRTLTPGIVYQIGRAFGTEAWQRGEQAIVVGRDGRLTSQEIADALIKGLCESGRDVIDLGLVPTPVVYFATHYLNARSAVMVTGSHNPSDYNGFKMVLQGETLTEAEIQQIYQRILSEDFSVGEGSYAEQNLIADYSARVQADIKIERKLKVVVDCGNGVAGNVVPALLRSIGCDVTELYCEVDGNFPFHHPDPSQPVNLQALIAAVKKNSADVGLAFDGDGDRLGVIDSQGNIIWPDRQLMLYAIDVLRQQPGAKVIYDVKSSRHLHRVIEQAGGQAIMSKTGHSLMKAKVKESGAVLAGEMSGHVFFKDRWYGFDDGLYTALRLLEILSKDQRSSAEVFAELPDAINTPELMLPLAEGEHFKLMQRLEQEIDLPDAQLVTIDGIRAEFKHGWGLVRASNTTPCLMFRFEADSDQELEHIKALFRMQLQKLVPELQLPF